MENKKSLREKIAENVRGYCYESEYSDNRLSFEVCDQILDLVRKELPEEKPRHHVSADTYGNGFNDAIDTMRERLGDG